MRYKILSHDSTRSRHPTSSFDFMTYMLTLLWFKPEMSWYIREMRCDKRHCRMNPIRSHKPGFSFDVNKPADSVFLWTLMNLVVHFLLHPPGRFYHSHLVLYYLPEWSFFRGGEEIFESALPYKSLRCTRSDPPSLSFSPHFRARGGLFGGLGGDGSWRFIQSYKHIRSTRSAVPHRPMFFSSHYRAWGGLFGGGQ